MYTNATRSVRNLLAFVRGRSKGIKLVLIIEHRDEVFARLAYDLSKIGIKVERAATTREASTKFGTTEAQLILMNRELSRDERGWLLVSKWALHRRQRLLWLYTDSSSAFDAQWAEFVKVEKLLYYNGDVWQLSDQVVGELSLANRCLANVARRRCKRVFSDQAEGCRATKGASLFCRGALIACATLILVAFFWQRPTAECIVVRLKSLCCRCCTDRALARLDLLEGVKHSWVNAAENNLVLEIDNQYAVSPRQIWEAVEHTHLKPDSLRMGRCLFSTKPSP